ncbi:hypothetical protein [Defluviimonas salinarum]|uniref:VWA domain-containing protein n=1 Tax=Defluviimonas salinarum TaxID=2992147 RepID=A0ABT3J464_9RHOB|nr:hypothetical protein [Defluviimonas salinarum]MCW3782481.1 hypothetical protein [Defluviimonas salinarum]
MGNGRWDAADWQSYSNSNVTGKSQAQVFTSRSMKPEFDPAKIAMRESRDSADNPASTPIILASDVTGSMGMIAEKLMRDGLNTLATGIYDRKPVTDPHILIAAVGDAKTDRAPLQVTQFEADIRVAKQARELWLEGNGGGNHGESYCLAHLFAALKTATDAAGKRARKGYLFTIGDEPVHDGVTRDELARVLGIRQERDLTARDCVEMAQRNWEVFHIVLANEGYARHSLDSVLRTWKPILPERTILLEDVDALAETVISLIQVTEGALAADVAASWSGSTALVVANALKGVPAKAGAARGLRRL